MKAPSSTTSRRQVLKSGLLAAAGFTLAPNLTSLAKHASSVEHPSEVEFLKRKVVGTTIKAKLNANENPFGPSKKVKQAIIDAIDNSYLYPREANKAFIKMIATAERVSEDCILLGAGSTELLMASALVFGTKGSSILSADPSYMSLIRYAESFGGQWEKVPLNKDYNYDFEAMKSKVSDKTSMVYICNPNNPTGVLADTRELMAFCETVSKTKPVFVDEAYIDYVPNAPSVSMIECVRKGHNVIVARTFSKVQAFAGLRIGYIIAQPSTIKEITKYTTKGGAISSTSINGALAAYNDTAFYSFSVAKNNESRAFLFKTLSEMKYDYLPSTTNFVLFPLKMNGKAFVEQMESKGVGVRSFEFDNKQWCRVSMGTMDSMKLFATAFKEVVGNS